MFEVAEFDRRDDSEGGLETIDRLVREFDSDLRMAGSLFERTKSVCEGGENGVTAGATP
jgi:hypothetical protein